MHFNIDIPTIFILLLVAASLVALIIKPRGPIRFLRIFIYIFAFLVLLRPHVMVSKNFKKDFKIGIFVDTSLSMSIENRYRMAKDTAKIFFSKLKNKADVKIYEFGDSIKEVQIDDIDNIKPSYNLTDISKVIKDDIFDGRIIITDGRYTTGINPLGVSETARVPIFTVGIGSSKKVPDLGITDLKTPGIGFREQSVNIHFTLVNHAETKTKTMIYLKEADVIISRKEIDLAGNKQIPVTIDFTPDEAGLKNYSIYVKKISGELNTTNNRRNFQLQVNRQKIRMLYVAGQPSWEYSYFRRLIKSDPQVELVSFLILRNPDNVTIVPEYELSLIHFPAREMFTNKIYEFDLLIYDNFSYQRFFPRSYLTHIKNFVMKGGAFIMLGGEDSYSRGGYVNTPIEDILPVDIKNKDAKWLVQEFSPILNQSANHPILNLADDIKMSKELWEEMPQLEGYDNGLKAKQQSTVLLKTEKGVPILTVNNVGQGRVMAFNANSTWRWCMGLAGKGKTPYYYNKFWYKVVRYMIQSGDLRNIQVFPGKDKAGIGERISVNIKVLDQYWRPVNNAKVKVEVIAPSGKRIPMGWVYPSGAGEDGWYHTTIPVMEEGVHKIIAKAYKQDRFLNEGEADFGGVTINKEFLNTSLNNALLEDISRISGGISWVAKNIEPEKIIPTLKNAVKNKKIVNKIGWHHWSIFLLLIIILAAEWYYRRIKGCP